MKARLLRVGVLVTVATLGLAGGAAARSSEYSAQRFESAEFEVLLSSESKLTFGLSRIAGAKKTFGFAEATLAKGTAAVSYEVALRSSPRNRIEFDLPGIGLIAVHFRERSRARVHRPWQCKGRSELVLRGVATGKIQLQAENDFLTVSASEAKGTIRSNGAERCEQAFHLPRHPGHRRHTADLLADGRAPQGAVGFLAYKSTSDTRPESDFSLLSGSLSRRRDGMTITESQTLESDDLSSFTTNREGRRFGATVTGAPPFSGTAELARQSDGTYDWTGTLSAMMPISGPVPLAGSGFKPTLCLDSHCLGQDPNSLVIVAVNR